MLYVQAVILYLKVKRKNVRIRFEIYMQRTPSLHRIGHLLRPLCSGGKILCEKPEQLFGIVLLIRLRNACGPARRFWGGGDDHAIESHT
jgi:hypothetical protein